MHDQTQRSRPGANRAATKEDSGGNFKDAFSVPEPAVVRTGADGFQLVNADGPIAIEDRHAAWTAGYEAGVAAGRVQAIAEDTQAVALAAEALQWIIRRANAAGAEGEAWAQFTAGPMPTGGDRRG